MSADSDLEQMAQKCIAAAELVDVHGSPALREAMRAALFILGRQLAHRSDKRLRSANVFARIVGKPSG